MAISQPRGGGPWRLEMRGDTCIRAGALIGGVAGYDRRRGVTSASTSLNSPISAKMEYSS